MHLTSVALLRPAPLRKRLWQGGLALLCLVAAGLMRTPFGVTLGWLIQVATLLSALVLPMMAIVGVIFTLLWVVCLWQGQRIDAIQAGRAAEAGH